MGKRAWAAPAVAASAALAACGGGGGGTEGAGPPLALTSVNYVDAAREAVGATLYLTDPNGLPYVYAETAAGSALAAVERLHGRRTALAAKAVAEVGDPLTMPCADGGQLTFTFAFPSGGTESSMRVEAEHCKEGTDTADGRFTLTTRLLSNAPYQTMTTIVFEDLATTSPSGRTTVQGRMDVMTSAPGVQPVTVAISVPLLSATSTVRGVETISWMSDYATTTVTTTRDGRSSTAITAGGTLSATGLGSRSIAVSTLTPLVRSGAGAPTAGQLRVGGAGAGSVTLTVQANSALHVELDADGDGRSEAQTTLPWSTAQ